MPFKKFYVFAMTFLAALSFPLFLASTAVALDSAWQSERGHIVGDTVQFDFRGGTATYAVMVPESSTVAVTVNNTIANKIGWNGQMADNWTITINGQQFAGNAIEQTTVSVVASGLVTIQVYGIDNGFWNGWYGPIFYAPVVSPTQVVPAQPEPTPTPSPSPVTESTTVVQTDPSPVPESSPSATPTPSPVESPTATATPEPSPEPSASPSAEPLVTPSPEPTPSSSPEPETATAVAPPETQTAPSETSTAPSQPVEPTPRPEIPLVTPPPPAVEPQPAPEPQPVPEPVPVEPPAPEPQPDPVPPAPEEPAPAPQPEPAPEPQPEPAPAPQPEPVPEPPVVPPVVPVVVEPVPTPTPLPTPEPVVNPEPSIASINDVDLATLPPDTPVELENGVVLTAEVVMALQVLENPAELLATIFTDPGQALKALANIGADMSPEERKKAQTTTVATVLAGAIVRRVN